MKLEDLSAADRKAIRTGKASAPRRSVPAKRQRAARSDQPSERVARVRCHTCGADFPHYGIRAERHADTHGGARLELVGLA